MTSLPSQGRLVVAANLRGHLRDFQQVVRRFEQHGAGGALLLLGNVVHGPYLSPAEYQAAGLCGPYYRDESPAVFLKLTLLQEKYPGRVVLLLGNHEYAHAGGPVTSRFAPDEALALRERLGADAAAYFDAFCGALPLWAYGPEMGLWFSHGGLPPQPEEVERCYTQPEGRARLGEFLWSPPLPGATAAQVLAGLQARGLVLGHEPVRGVEQVSAEQLVLTSSFGLADADKRILELDLGQRYESLADLRPGHEILPLYS